MGTLFVQLAFDPDTQFFYFAWVLTVIVSITVHELAHGWAAIRRGDMTPMLQGRLTGNPLVHMGPLSLGFLLIIGFAYGQMPIDPTRLKGKYAEAWVAFAGPLSNLLLGVAALTGLGLWLRFVGPPADDNQIAMNAVELAQVFGMANLFLFALNLLPLPPLDGSHILANFNAPFRRFVYDPANQQWMLMGMIAIFILGPLLFGPAMRVGLAYLTVVAG